MAGRAEQNGIPGCFACGGVRRCVALAEIRFGFDDSPGNDAARRLPHQQLPQQRPRYLPRIAIEELGFE
jgi:hypothetical protein